MKNLIISVTYVLLTFCFPIIGKAQIHPDDSLQLVNLYTAVCNDNCTLNWDLQQPSTWSGVTLNADGRVTSIRFINRGLTNQIPDFSLTSLTWLELQINELSGQVPNFSGCPNLKHADFLAAAPN